MKKLILGEGVGDIVQKRQYIHLSNQAIDKIDPSLYEEAVIMFEDSSLEAYEQAEKLLAIINQVRPGEYIFIETGDYIYNEHRDGVYDPWYKLIVMKAADYGRVKKQLIKADKHWRQEIHKKCLEHGRTVKDDQLDKLPYVFEMES
jgi:hypothetical protein